MSGVGAPRWFVLWAEDQDFHCSCLEERFRVIDVLALREIIGEEARDDPELTAVYWLDDDQLKLLVVEFGIGLNFLGFEHVGLEDWSPLRDVPYLVHTRFELFLLLEGRKQLAAFSEFGPSDWLEEHLSPFNVHVASGRLVRREIKTPLARSVRSGDGQVYDHLLQIFFSLPGQEWRIEAYLLMDKVSQVTGWNETLETLEGSLYGYEDWQIDWWLADYRRRRTDRNPALPRGTS